MIYRHLVNPAQTVEQAEAEVRAFLIVPGWSEGTEAAEGCVVEGGDADGSAAAGALL